MMFTSAIKDQDIALLAVFHLVQAVRNRRRRGLVDDAQHVEPRNQPRVLGGLGTAIMSTSTGVCTASEAAKRGVGGEVLCFIW